MVPTAKKFSDEDNVRKWKSLLKTFEAIIQGNPPAKSVEAELGELKNMASTSNLLTARQSEAIFARCDNYIKGQYGATKTSENYDYAAKN